jgi:iron complex outermembrane receptor protein
MRNLPPTWVLLSAFSIAVSPAALATDNNVSMLEEIIVTAEKRESSVQETPIAITAITSDQLRDLGIYSQQDIANFTPNMSYQESAGGGEGNRIYLRGIGRETSSTGTDPGVGIYNNGFYTTEAGVLSGSFDRIARIEVLRGPQGTLFGRNTTGGAINVVAKKPGEASENIVRLRAGNYGMSNVDITSSGPINDRVGYLLHYSNLQQDSFFTNLSGADPKGTDSDYIEAQLDVDFTDNINWHMRYFSARFDNETLNLSKLDGYRNEPGAPSKLGELVINPELFSPLSDAPADPFDISSDIVGFVGIDDQRTYHSTLSIDLPALQIKILNGYQDYSWYGEKDFDGTASPVSYVEKIGQAETNKQHEIQFISNDDGDISWVAGLFYYSVQLDQPYTLTDAANPYLINAANPYYIHGTPTFDNPDGQFYYQVGQLDATSKAAYGQIDWQVNDKLALSFGARYSEDEKDGFEYQTQVYDAVLDYCSEAFLPYMTGGYGAYFDPASVSPAATGCRFGIVAGGGQASHNAKWDALDWRINASYDLSADSMVYATLSTAYKPGGFRLGGLQDDASTSVNESIVDNEDLLAVEFGYKGIIGDSLSLSAALFYYDYSDLQVELAILNRDTGIVTAKLANASSATLFGLEIESKWAATDQFTLLANLSMLETEYDDDFFVSDNKRPNIDPSTNTDTVRNVKGNELNRSPNHKLSVAAYFVQPTDSGNWVISGNYSHIGEQFMTVFNDPIETVSSYSQLNARIAWKPASNGYELSIFASNLTDELSYANDYSVSSFADGVRRSGRPINPRTYGIELGIFF